MGKNIDFSKKYFPKHQKNGDYIDTSLVTDRGGPILDEDFFKNNRLRELSNQRLLYSILMRPDTELLASKNPGNDADKRETEADLIRKTDDLERLIGILEGNPHPLNHASLIDKIAGRREEAIWLLLDKFRDPSSDTIVELGARVVHRTGINCAGSLIDLIKNGPGNAYWNSMLCVLLGFMEHEHAEQVLWDQFFILNEQFPGETYCDGPLLGLHTLSAK